MLEKTKAQKMFELALRLEKFDKARMLKCEICGPILRGADPSKYPACKRHNNI